MTHVDLKLLMVVMFVTSVACQNSTTPAPAPAAGKAPPQAPQQLTRPGALASLLKMFIDIPLGVVEACKDAAEAIEGIVVGFMRSIFK